MLCTFKKLDFKILTVVSLRCLSLKVPLKLLNLKATLLLEIRTLPQAQERLVWLNFPSQLMSFSADSILLPQKIGHKC